MAMTPLDKNESRDLSRLIARDGVAVARAAFKSFWSPTMTAETLEAIAQDFRESASDLAASWQDPNAGKCWAVAAQSLDRVAARLRRVDK